MDENTPYKDLANFFSRSSYMLYYDTTTRGIDMWERTRIKLEVYVELDGVPGTFHTKESARQIVEAILKQQIPHYNPSVDVDYKD